MSESSPTPTESASPAVTDRNYRLAKAVSIGLGVAIILAIAVIIYGVSAGWGHRATPVAKAKAPVSMTLAPGYRILSSDTQPGRLILRVRSDTVDEVWVINTDDGSIVARIHGETPAQ